MSASKKFRNFISFEGLDFSGKSTQIALLIQKLAAAGIVVQVVREPGGTVISEKIRAILLDPLHREMHAKTEILLYSAARAQLVHSVVLPALQAGKWVVADRFFDSTTAYQGQGRGIDYRFVENLNEFATSGLQPFKTFFIDVSPETALQRRKAAGRESDRLEVEGLKFYRTIRRCFRELAGRYPDRFIRVNGENSETVVAAEIWQHVTKIWNLPA